MSAQLPTFNCNFTYHFNFQLILFSAYNKEARLSSDTLLTLLPTIQFNTRHIRQMVHLFTIQSAELCNHHSICFFPYPPPLNIKYQGAEVHIRKGGGKPSTSALMWQFIIPLKITARQWVNMDYRKVSYLSAHDRSMMLMLQGLERNSFM